MDLEAQSLSQAYRAACWKWQLVFYLPCFVFPQTARIFTIIRNMNTIELSNAFKGLAFGLLQDLAIFCQALVLIHCILLWRNFLLSCIKPTDPLLTTWRHTTLRTMCTICSVFVLVCAYLWITLVCVMDLSLLFSYLPRINRGFVTMYLNFSSQFASSLEEALTFNSIIYLGLYCLSMGTWVYSVLYKIQLPTFSFLFCVPPPTANKKRLPVSLGLFTCLMQLISVSNMSRTMCITMVVLVSALNATIALDGDGNDIYLFSNAMFSLEFEEFLRPTHHSMLLINGQELNTNKMSSFIKETLGINELFEFPDGNLSSSFPFYRHTKKYIGEKHFELVHDSNFTKTKTSNPLNEMES